jgi:hypothetical protein
MLDRRAGVRLCQNYGLYATLSMPPTSSVLTSTGLSSSSFPLDSLLSAGFLTRFADTSRVQWSGSREEDRCQLVRREL